MSEPGPFQLLSLTGDGDGVATIRLQRTEAKNALNMELKAELADAIARVGEDASVRAVVITGQGDAFCAGGDIREMVKNDRPETSRHRLEHLLGSVFVPLAELAKPTVAAVNGHAHGAGLSLALACDVVVASRGVSLSCAFTKMGLVPDCGALYFLPRRLPMGVAKELVYSGRRLSADEACALGLVNQVVEPDELADVAGALAGSFAAAPPIALAQTKRLLDASLQSTLRELAVSEALAQAVCYASDDHVAAREAFVAKSAPVFHGR